MTERELRAAFTRHEALTPPAGPVRAAIDRVAAVRRRRRQRVRAAGVALALVGALGVGLPQLAPRPSPQHAPTVAGPSTGLPTGALNLLVLGLDTRSDGAPPSADSVLIVHIPADRSRPYLISLPRDLEVKIPGFQRSKLNAAFAYGAGSEHPDRSKGYDLTRRVVADLTGVRVDAGVVLTFSAMRKATDVLGGVEICLPQQVESVHTRRVYPAGCHRLDGAASLDLLRQRRGMPDGALDRDRNAQRFAAGVVRQVAEQGALTDPVQMSRILAAITPELTVAGNMSVPDLLRVVPELSSADPVGLSLPVVWPEVPSSPTSTGETGGLGLRADPQAAPAFLTALREDRLAQWAAANPERVTRLR
ncbi:LCP family protein [Micromonospora avicenniae]|uniref:Transcriptional attenuator, LytR family n=1 Tax=Micromonospora avicenniae TaxID=1198245 RepID=A0A1N6U6C1_9ACTN|nr:LCP family protein [Micromonospora avicenniae]SIQ61130.1 transcriptional attenuator, LytR family [Micromonospora avicenniae]